MDRANVAPRSSNTMDTVVEVGIPRELKTSRSMISVTITARKIYMSSLNANCSGLKIPCRAMSIMPLLMMAPRNTPVAATKMMVLNLATLAPIAELRKLTASLLTPTQRSEMARMKRNITNPR